MQAIVETLFDTVYLFSVITIGILMIRKSKGNRQFTMFGIMAVILGSGDAFHLVPRATALCTTGLENFTVQLGLGKWITSVTMTIFYVVLYHIWRERYQIKGYKATTAAIYGLAGLRIVLCMMPQNAWLSVDAPLSWGIYRNIPVVLLADVIPMIGMLMIPKTCAYVWTVLIGYKAMKKDLAIFQQFYCNTEQNMILMHYMMMGKLLISIKR